MRPSRRSTDPGPSTVNRDAGDAAEHGERGSASLEFLTVGVLLLVPIVYLVLALASVQGGALAVEGAARQAARIAVQTGDRSGAAAAVDRAVRVTLADYGVDAGAASVVIDCQSARCDAPGTRVRVTVEAHVRLPLVPDVLELGLAGTVPVEASATQTVSRFARGGS
ncbi:TadE family protein [Agromyces sp. SYSU K20354]|uniref:TadE family protein n=1 Tax=Agromyces cavernae TaxID=2898659 RepID=UPI001E4E165C|nr:TadE family protein [Agromyces cavernae]MCD2442587.1 TadE family protein [Agromyces cavernae]